MALQLDLNSAMQKKGSFFCLQIQTGLSLQVASHHNSGAVLRNSTSVGTQGGGEQDSLVRRTPLTSEPPCNLRAEVEGGGRAEDLHRVYHRVSGIASKGLGFRAQWPQHSKSQRPGWPRPRCG